MIRQQNGVAAFNSSLASPASLASLASPITGAGAKRRLSDYSPPNFEWPSAGWDATGGTRPPFPSNEHDTKLDCRELFGDLQLALSGSCDYNANEGIPRDKRRKKSGKLFDCMFNFERPFCT